MSCRCLIVDDERNSRELLREALAPEPYRVFCASSAREALDIMEKETVDVVVSDEKMPGMSGSEFLSLVRQKFPDTVRIILTGHANLQVAVRSINEGEVYRFFTKPCNIFDLVVTIRHAVREKVLMEENRRLLEIVRSQSSLIRTLEEDFPGITRVKKDTKGQILLDDGREEGACEVFVEEIERLVSACKGRSRSDLSCNKSIDKSINP